MRRAERKQQSRDFTGGSRKIPALAYLFDIYFSEMVTDVIMSPVKVGFVVGSRRVRPLTTFMPLITCPNMV
jgi:hypothetical protein